MHTNSLDEAFAIPSEAAIKVAVRTQQILLEETGVADVVDPLAGSYYIEHLTAEIEGQSEALIANLDAQGGLIAAVESGYANQLIADSAWEQQVEIESKERIVVGVNEHVDDDRSTGGIEVFQLHSGTSERQMARLSEVKRSRHQRRVIDALKAIEVASPDLHTNLMPLIEEAVRARCTVGEVCDVLRETWGTFQPSTAF